MLSEIKIGVKIIGIKCCFLSDLKLFKNVKMLLNYCMHLELKSVGCIDEMV